MGCSSSKPVAVANDGVTTVKTQVTALQSTVSGQDILKHSARGETALRNAAQPVVNKTAGTADAVITSVSGKAQDATNAAVDVVNGGVASVSNAVPSEGKAAWQSLGAPSPSVDKANKFATDAAAAGRAKVAAGEAMGSGAVDAARQAVGNGGGGGGDGSEEEDEDDGPSTPALLTARKQVGGCRCIVTIHPPPRDSVDGGVLVRVFHPASEAHYELRLAAAELRESLPEDVLGEECQTEQLHYIRDNLRLTGPMDARVLELIPAGSAPLNVLLRDRRIIGGRTAHITIGLRSDGIIVVRAFNPASEVERELLLTPGQLRALLPGDLVDEAQELEQLHFISHNLHYTRRNGQVQLQLVPEGSMKYCDEVDAATADLITAKPRPTGAADNNTTGNGGDGEGGDETAAQSDADSASAADSDDDGDGDGDTSLQLLHRTQVRIDNRRVFVTIYRRHDTLVIRALNPAAQHESELVLPLAQLPHLLPAELLAEEAETDMLRHIADDLCFRDGARRGIKVLALRGEVHASHVRDDGEAPAGSNGDGDDNDDQPDLVTLLRERRHFGSIRAYLTIGRRGGVLIVNVFSPARSAEVEIELPASRLVYIIPPELQDEALEHDMVHYLADLVQVEPAGNTRLKVTIKGAPPPVPTGDPDDAISEALLVHGAEHTVTAERHDNTLVVLAYDIATGTTTTMTADLRQVRVELATGTVQEQALVAPEQVDALIGYMLPRLEYVQCPLCTRLEVAGVTGPGAFVNRGFSRSVAGANGDYYILGLKRSQDMKNVECSAFNTTTHATITDTISMDSIAAAFADDPDGPALLKEVKVAAFFERLADDLFIDETSIAYRPQQRGTGDADNA